MTELSTETSLALIQKDLKYMTTGIDEVKSGIKEINARFATKEEVEERIKNIETRASGDIQELREEIAMLKGASNFWKVINPTLAAVLSSVLTFFIISYFTHSIK